MALAPHILEKSKQISEKGDFTIFITLLGPTQYLSFCARAGSVYETKISEMLTQRPLLDQMLARPWKHYNLFRF